MQLISRVEAIAKGLKSYFTGVPCSKGHIATRTTDSCVCHECRLIMRAKKRLSDGQIPKPKTEIEKRQGRKNALKKYAENNPEKVKLSQAKYKAEHPDRRKASVTKWDSEHPESRRLHSHTRRARKKAIGGILSIGLAEKLFKLQKGKCPCCGLPLGDDYHLDHKMPLALGGSNTDDNIQLLRSGCNQKKSAKHPIDFMQSKGFLL